MHAPSDPATNTPFTSTTNVFPSDSTVVREPNFPLVGTAVAEGVGLAQLGVSACHASHPLSTCTCTDTYIYPSAGLALVDLVSLEVGEPAALR
jgi:hypothetical protein